MAYAEAGRRETLVSKLICISFLAMLFFSAPAYALFTPVAGASYQVQDKGNGKLLWCVYGPNEQEQLMDYRGDGQTVWTFTDASDGYYRIYNAYRNLVLSCQSGSSVVQVVTGDASDGAYWTFQDEGNGWMSLLNRLTGLVATITQTSSGVYLTVASNQHLDSQKFMVESFVPNPLNTIAVPSGYTTGVARRMVLCSSTDLGASVGGSLNGTAVTFNFAKTQWGQYYYLCTDTTKANSPGSYTLSVPEFPSASFVVSENYYQSTSDGIGANHGIGSILSGFYGWQRYPSTDSNIPKVTKDASGNYTQVGTIASVHNGWKDATSSDMETPQDAASLRNLAYAAADTTDASAKSALLAEVAWGASYFVLIQNSDGSFPIKYEPYTNNPLHSYYLQVDKCAFISARTVSALAAASRVLRGYNDTLANQAFAAAVSGWDWVKANQTTAISDTAIYGWLCNADSLVAAAIEMASANSSYQADASAFFNAGQFDGSAHWVKKTGAYVNQNGGNDAALSLARYYRTLPDSNADKAAIAAQLWNYYNTVLNSIDTPFGVQSGWFGGGFGGNGNPGIQQYVLLNLYSALGDARMLNGACDMMSWLQGCNPFASSFIVGFGSPNTAPQFARPRDGSIGEILPGILSVNYGSTITTWGGSDYATGEGGAGDTSYIPAFIALMEKVWRDSDIGSPAIQGSASCSNGVWTVAGSGSDIWNTSDQFNFVSGRLSGDQCLVSKVTSITKTDVWAKAGVMFRDTAAANSMAVGILASASNGVIFQWRNAAGGSCSYAGASGVATPTPSSPVWLKLVKSGAAFTGYYSTDGAVWTAVGSTNVGFSSSSYFGGLAVSSHTNSALNTATFSNASVSGDIVNGTVYEITPLCTLGSGLDVNGISTADGANVQIWQFIGAKNQLWQATDDGGGLWEFAPTHAMSERLEVQGGGSSDMTNVCQFTANGGSAEKWKLYDNGDGTFSLEPQCAPGKRLDVQYSGSANGTNVEIYSNNHTNAQKWIFYPH